MLESYRVVGAAFRVQTAALFRNNCNELSRANAPPRDRLAKETAGATPPALHPLRGRSRLRGGANHDGPPLAQKPPPRFLSWEGLYIGANLGAGIPIHKGERLQASSGFTSSAFDLYPQGRERAGISFGAQAGYNWQAGPWVYGLETDFNFLDGRGGQSGVFQALPAYLHLGVATYTLNYEEPARYFASIRGRLGFAIDRTLYYATGGVAAGARAVRRRCI